MSFGIYIHIPYCLQRCSYCDFATVSFGQSEPPQYFKRLVAELELRAPLFRRYSRVTSVYFGGGTPSLVGPDFILAVLAEIKKQGFEFDPGIEITIEINPATMDLRELESYMQGGVNRFSVGAQTFSEKLLAKTGRKHSVQDTVDTLQLISKQKAHYTLDLLFALPQQTLADVASDVERILELNPPHVSAYCLTVSEHHPMSRARAPEAEQAQMFELIQTRFEQAGLERYEISNFARPGLQSRHNLLYWSGEPYWGVGLSAHSYLPEMGDWGVRYWNHGKMSSDDAQIAELTRKQAPLELPPRQIEWLEAHQAMTDYSHTRLRQLRGLRLAELRRQFPQALAEELERRLRQLNSEGWVETTGEGFRLSPQGLLLCNLVFERLTVLKSELARIDNRPTQPIFKDRSGWANSLK